MKKILVAGLVAVSSMYGAVVKSLEFQGLVHLSPEVASEMIGISVGDSVDIEMIDTAIKKLYKQKYFEDVWAEDGEDGKLIFHFKEKPTVANVDIIGISENDKEEILGIAGIKKGEVYDQEKAELAKLKIIKHYEMKGYFDTVVEEEKKDLNEGSLALTFVVNRGEEIYIQSIELCGAQNLEYSDFEPSIANKEPEWLPWMWGFNDGKLRLADLEYDNERIKDVYMQNGYMDAIVSSPYLQAYMDSYKAKLTYHIDEGQQYKIGSIKIDMPEDLMLDSNELLSDLILQEGQVFNIKRLRKDVAKVKRAVADLGYAYAKVLPDINNDKEKALTHISLRVIPGDKVYINDVRISGNTRTIDRVVRREIYLSYGDLYSQTDLDDTIGALKRSSYFEDVRIEEKKVSKDKIDLVVHVKEANTGSIGGGIGYGSSDGLLLNAQLSDSNIFGSGLKASIDVERSDDSLTGKIGLTNPRIFDSVYSLSGSLYATDTEYYYYDQATQGFNLTVGRKLGRYTSASLGYALEQSDISNLDSTLAAIFSESTTLKSSIIPAISFNNTDDYYLPRKGMSTSLAIEIAGLGGDLSFVKSTAKFAYYYGLEDLIDYDLILRYRAKAQYLTGSVDNLIGERLYMGGISSVRGYESNSLSPENSSGTLYGGTMMFANTIEASIPLIDRLKMRGSWFFDYGMIGDDDLSIKRAGTGFNLEWQSPMGAILLIFSKALMNESGDRTSTFEFTMGRQF